MDLLLPPDINMIRKGLSDSLYMYENNVCVHVWYTLIKILVYSLLLFIRHIHLSIDSIYHEQLNLWNTMITRYRKILFRGLDIFLTFMRLKMREKAQPMQIFHIFVFLAWMLSMIGN